MDKMQISVITMANEEYILDMDPQKDTVGTLKQKIFELTGKFIEEQILWIMDSDKLRDPLSKNSILLKNIKCNNKPIRLGGRNKLRDEDEVLLAKKTYQEIKESHPERAANIDKVYSSNAHYLHDFKDAETYWTSRGSIEARYDILDGKLPGSNRISVKAMDGSGNMYRVEVGPIDTIGALKQKLSKEKGFILNEQIIRAQNKQTNAEKVLDDHDLVSSYHNFRISIAKEDRAELIAKIILRGPPAELITNPTNTNEIKQPVKPLTTANTSTKVTGSIKPEEVTTSTTSSSSTAQPHTQSPSDETSLKPAETMTFTEFHRQFLALYDETNSTGIKRIIKDMEKMKGSDMQKFIAVGKLMHNITVKRKDLHRKPHCFFGGRSKDTQIFYNYTQTKTLDSAKSFNDLIVHIKDNAGYPGQVWEEPSMTFAKFCKDFKRNFEGTNSSGIKKIIKHMDSLLHVKAVLKNDKQYKFTKICQIMHKIAADRVGKDSKARKDNAREFYKKAACKDASTTADFINEILTSTLSNISRPTK